MSQLSQSMDLNAPSHQSTNSLLGWFDRISERIPSIKTPMILWLAAALSALVVLALAVVYVGLILGLAWFTLDYMISHLKLLSNGATWGSVLAYVIPAIIVLLMLLLLIKPLFRVGQKEDAQIELSPRDEPMLFQYIERLCRLLDTPQPASIKIDISCNAGVTMRGSGENRKLDMMLGLSLIAASDIRAFTGILAHELGHFTQRKGMRVQLFINRINMWFAHVVYERDAFDYWLYRISRPGLGPFRLFGIIMSFIVSVGRRLVWLFMLLAHAASCLISRRAEYDADRYMALITGSDHVGVALQKTSIVDMALDASRDDLIDSWRQGKLADNIPQLAVHRSKRLSDEQYRLLVRLIRANRTKWHDTHPALVDRVSAAKKLKLTGLLDDDRPAGLLFGDFDQTCRKASHLLYEQRLEKKFDPKSVVPTQRLIDEIDEREKAHKALRRYYQGEAMLTRPIFPDSFADTPPVDPTETLAEMTEARQQIIDRANKIQDTFNEYGALDEHMRILTVAENLVKSGISINAAEFGLHEGSINSIRMGQRQLKVELKKVSERLEKMEGYIRTRMSFGLSLMHTDTARTLMTEQGHDVDDITKRTHQLMAICNAIEPTMDDVRALSRSSVVMASMLSISEPQRAPRKLHRAMEEHSGKVHGQLSAIRGALVHLPYPFSHGKADATVGSYIVDEIPPASDMPETMMQGLETLERVDTLLSRVLAQLAVIAEQVETALGLDVAEEPDNTKDMKEVVEQLERTATSRNVSISGAGVAAFMQVGIMFCVVAGLIGIAFGASKAVPTVVSTVVPSHQQYRPTTIPQSWVAPQPTWPNNDPYGRGYQPGGPNANPNFPNSRQPNWPNNNPYNANRNPNQPNYPKGYNPNRNPTYRPNQPRVPTPPRYQPNRGYNPNRSTRPSTPSRPGPSIPRPSFPGR